MTSIRKKRTSVRNALASALVAGVATVALSGVGTAYANDAELPDQPEGDSVESLSKDAEAVPRTLEEAKENLDAANASVDEARAASEEAQGRVDEAQKAKEEAQNEYAEAVEDLDTAEQAAEDAFTEVNDVAQQDAADAQATVEAAEQDLEDKQTDAGQAEQQVRQAREDSEAAQQNLIEAVHGARANAATLVEKAQQALADAQEIADRAHSAFETAQGEFDRISAEADTLPAVGEAKAALERAHQALEVAMEHKTMAERLLSQAQAAESAAEAEAANLLEEKTVLDAAESAANEEKDAANAAYSAADAAERIASAALDAAQQSLREASAALDAVAPLDDLKAAYDAAVGDESAKKGAVDAAVAALAHAQAQGERVDNALEFFQAVGSKVGVSALTDSQYSSFTDVNSATDATALDNVKKVFQFIRECNAIRASLGLNELKVTDSLMSMSMANLNWSDTNMNHSRQFRNVAENLSWGYGTREYKVGTHASTDWSNPFTGWYDAEKAIYDSAKSSNWDGLGDYETWLNTVTTRDGMTMTNDMHVGHYLNIINPSYLYTGFAYNNGQSPYGNAFGQTFSVHLFSLGGAADTAYTVDEYEQRFLDVIGTLYQTEDQQRATAEAQTALDAASNAYAQAVSTTADAKTAYESAMADWAAKQAAYDSANQKLQVAQADYSVAVAAKENASLALCKANEAARNAANRFAEADAAYQGARAVYNEAVAALDAAARELAEADNAVLSLQDDMDRAQDVLDQAHTRTVEAKTALDACGKALESARAEVSSLADELEAAKSLEELALGAERELDATAKKIEGARHALKAHDASAVSALAEVDEGVRAALDARNTAESALNAAQAALEDAQNGVDIAQIAFAKAQEALQSANDRVLRAAALSYAGSETHVQDDEFSYLNDYVDAVAKAELAVNQAQGTLNAASAAYDAAVIERDNCNEAYIEALEAAGRAQADYARLLPDDRPGAPLNGDQQDALPASGAVVTTSWHRTPAHARSGVSSDGGTQVQAGEPFVSAEANDGQCAGDGGLDEAAIRPTPAGGAEEGTMPKTGDGSLTNEALAAMMASLAALVAASRRREHEAE